MPYRSQAQQRKFHSDPALRKFTPEFDAATDFSKLPKRVSAKKTPAKSGIAMLLGKGKR